MNSVHPGLGLAEQHLAGLHLLEFNGKLKSEAVVDGHVYKLDDVYISQRLNFDYNDVSFKFKSVSTKDASAPADEILKACCVKVTRNGEVIQTPEFLDMPAFVIQWLEQIVTTVSIDGPKSYRGLTEVMELFSG